MKFPDMWPPDCPPSDAVDADGQVFRIVDHDPPIAQDFGTPFETNRLANRPPCLRCGLSVFREVRDARHQRHLFPNLGRLIAQGTLNVEHGKTKPTGKQPTHTTWWAYENVNRASHFSVFTEEG